MTLAAEERREEQRKRIKEGGREAYEMPGKFLSLSCCEKKGPLEEFTVSSMFTNEEPLGLVTKKATQDKGKYFLKPKNKQTNKKNKANKKYTESEHWFLM